LGVVTDYAVNPETSELLAVWRTSDGSLARVVAGVEDTAAACQLAASLTNLSEQLWRTYTHAAEAAGDPSEANTTAWRRKANRDAFERVLSALSQPNLPTGGALLVSYNPVEEAAHRVGRALHQLGGPEVSASVSADVSLEVDAVNRAELGDLSGRAAQGALLSRPDASPTQVQAAWDVLATGPIGTDYGQLLALDPAAASVAAAQWLRGAAMVAADVAGVHWTAVVQEADNIQALACESPTRVLTMLDEGSSAPEVVTAMVADALAVADGVIPDLTDLLEEVDDARERAAEYEDQGVPEQEFLPTRLTPLDPHRPAPDLLEDLIGGIEGAFLLWREHDDDDDGDDEVRWAEADSQAAERFDAAVQARMTGSDLTAL
jgi:hypothetical protein